MVEDIIITMSEEDFIKSLTHPKSKKDYILERNKKIKEIESCFKKEKRYLVDKVSNIIEQDKRHSSIINSCTSPFTHGPLSKTDYKFIRAAPLFELQLPNMDFLLFKRNSRCNIAIFGECKGSFSDPANVIKELKERRNHIEQKKDYIISNYLHLPESETVMPGQAPMRHENVGLGLYPGMIISLNYETGNQRRSVSGGFISPRE